jgi:hypothetical protein
MAGETHNLEFVAPSRLVGIGWQESTTQLNLALFTGAIEYLL